METVNERFLRLRKQILGMSRREFAEKVGMTESEVKNIDYGLTSLKENRIRTVCSAFGIREDWLRNGVEPIKIPRTLGEEIGAVVAAVAYNRPADARAFFERLYNELGEARFLLLYEIFREMFPQYDKPPNK